MRADLQACAQIAAAERRQKVMGEDNIDGYLRISLVGGQPFHFISRVDNTEIINRTEPHHNAIDDGSFVKRIGRDQTDGNTPM